MTAVDGDLLALLPSLGTDLDTLVARLESATGQASAKALVDLITGLERVRRRLDGVVADATVQLRAAQREEDLAAGVAEARAGETAGAQVALARRVGPAVGARQVSLAGVLHTELPHTLAAMHAGEASEHQASIVASGTVFLSRDDRLRVDEAIATELGQLSPGRLEKRVRELAYEADAEGFVRHTGLEAHNRRVGLKPKPNTMTTLTAYLPAAQGVAVWAALDAAAMSARAAGDERSLDQVRADTLVERVTGQVRAETVPVEVQLVMTPGALFTEATGHADRGDARGDGLEADGTEPDGTVEEGQGVRGAGEAAVLTGYGPVPAPVARALVRPVAGVDETQETKEMEEARVFLRRLFTDPATGSLVDRDSRRRLFSRAHRELLVARDQTCRTPWCEAPVRQADHVTPHSRGGPTTIANGQGLCTRCNLTKTHPRWQAAVARDPVTGHQVAVTTTTPTGHAYTSPTPPAPGVGHPARDPAAAEPPTPAACSA